MRGTNLLDFAKLVDTLQHVSGTLVPRYNYILDISALLKMHRDIASTNNWYVAVSEISLLV